MAYACHVHIVLISNTCSARPMQQPVLLPLLSNICLSWTWLLSHHAWPYFQLLLQQSVPDEMLGRALCWATLVFLCSPDYNEYKAFVCQVGTEMGPLSLWHDCPCHHITFDPRDGIPRKAESCSLLINTDILLAEKRDGVISYFLQLICSSSSLILLLNSVNMKRVYPFLNLCLLFSDHNTGST